MNQARTLPFAGIAIAVVTGIAMIVGGAGIGLVLLALAVWIFTLWISTPPPPPPADPLEPDRVRLTRTGMRDLIEHSGLPMLMLDGNRIIVANAAAREDFGQHVVGQDARVAFRHPAAVDILSRPEGGSATIQGLTSARSIWEMRRQPIDGRYWLIELVNRTAEADVSRAHTDFVANASHELRTPLASIIGYVDTLVEEGDTMDPARVQRFHGTVLREARRLQALVDDLMSLSQVEAEKHDQPRERLDLTPLVTQSARDGAGPDRTQRLELALPDGAIPIRGDRRQLEQLVRNLVDNALKYGLADQPVTVTLAPDDRNMVVLTVRDRGEGIAPEHLPHLTRRFYRTDPGRSRAAGGTGLGLAIVKHIVERHRGRLDIASRQGDGTTVTVRLPMVVEDAAPVP